MDSEPFSLRCCGVCDGRASATRFHSAFLYRFGRARFLVDCGQPVSLGLKAAGVGADELDRVFLSHMHFDHTSGLGMLIQGFWLDGRRRELPIHLPVEGVEPLRQMLQAGYLFDDLLPFRMDWQAHRSGVPVVWNGLRVTPFPTTHLDRMRRDFQQRFPRPFEAFAFLLESERARVAHSADIGSPRDLDPLLERPVDLLVCELAHVEPSDLFNYLAAKQIGTVCLVHLPEELFRDLDSLRDLANRMLPQNRIVIPTDGEDLEL
jgi:ribonuclease Z